ncbi:hypothetical protein HPULCUR_009237 [Helicostylum pulchrum]|uniref:Uncharacterized protein n=1 Tax=Helicostylum pulchrum TaxID=562976 RepID=A0ABP9YAY6_9FUNG
MESRTGSFLGYMYNHFKNLKDSFKDYQAYASGYDPHQCAHYAKDSEFEPYYNPSTVTDSTERLLKTSVSPKERMMTLANTITDNVTHTFAYGAFAVANYLYPKKNGSSDEYDNDEYDTDILSRATCIDENGVQYPPAKPVDDSWGIIDSDNLSVEFKCTNPPPKPSRWVIKLRK